MSGLRHFVETLRNFTSSRADDILVIDPFSIGDVFQSLSIVSAFCKINKVDSINFVTKYDILKIVKMFPVVKNLYVNMHLNSVLIELLANTDWYKNQNKFFIMPPNMHLSLISHTGQLDGADMMFKKKKILGLSKDDIPLIPSLDSKVMEEISAKAKSLGITPNSVIIFNHARTMKPIKSECYFELNKIFPGEVFFDSFSNDIPSWARVLNIEIHEIPYYANYAGTVIALRSGITELLSMSSAKIFTIYPSSNYMQDWFSNKEMVASQFRTWGIKDLGLNLLTSEVQIFIENDDDTFAISKKIIKSLCSN